MAKAKRKPKPASKPKGICCPHCGVRLKAVRTVQRVDGSTMRKRRCKKCKFSQKTFERVQGEQRS